MNTIEQAQPPMKRAFATNLRKMRKHRGIASQEKAASLIGVKARTFAAWEEGRGEPNSEMFVRIADLFGITNLSAFLSDPNFDPKAQDKTRALCMQSPLQSNFVRSIS